MPHLPEGISTDAIGVLISLSVERMVSKGTLTDPLKLNPNMASTTTEYWLSISIADGRLSRKGMLSFSH